MYYNQKKLEAFRSTVKSDKKEKQIRCDKLIKRRTGMITSNVNVRDEWRRLTDCLVYLEQIVLSIRLL